jgi:methyl-accepting chemotaxis protein
VSGSRRVPGLGLLGRAVPDWLRRRYVRKLGASLLVVVLVVATVSVPIYAQVTGEMTRDSKDQLERTAELEAENVEQWLGQLREQTSLLAGTLALRNPGETRVGTFLRTEQKNMPGEVVAIHHVDTESGTVLDSSSEASAGVNLRDQGVVWAGEDSEAMSAMSGLGTTHVTDPYWEPLLGSFTVAVLAPVEGVQNRAVVVVVDITRRSEQMQLSANGTTTTNVVDGQGRLVLSQTGEDLGSQYVTPYGVQTAPVERGLAGESGYDELEANGTATSVGYAPVEGTDWVVVVEQPTSTTFAQQRQISRLLLVLIVALLLSFGLVAGAFGQHTTRGLRELAATAEALDQGDLDVDISTGRIDEFGTTFAAFEGMRDSLRRQIQEAEQARQEAERARERTEQLNEELTVAAEEYAQTMEACADGDLTRRLDPADHEAMEQIAVAFNEMIDDIEAATAELSSFAESVAAGSEEVTASAREVQAAGDRVAEATQRISEGADRQREQFSRVSEEMSEMSATTEEVASSSDQVAALAERTADRGEEGEEAAEAAIAEMNAVEEEAREAVDEIEGLQDSVDEIGAITEIIADIAEQTNILALNASIEASRAGEAGEGFAVVAEEVKDLAEETRDSAEEIESLVDEVQSRTEQTADEVRRTSDVAAESAAAVERAAGALSEIAEFAAETNVGVQQIRDASSRQAEATQAVVTSVEEAGDISDETADEAADAAAAAEEQTSTLSEVTDSAEDLADQAVRLRSMLEQFEVREDVAGGGAIDADVAVDIDDETAADD